MEEAKMQSLQQQDQVYELLTIHAPHWMLSSASVARKGRVVIYNHGDPDHRTHKTKPTKTKQITPF